MRVTRLSLRNFRVFPELDLEVPPGVVGVYGPNGAGKSTLVESILWALFGVARTGKESLRADGATAETVATVEFEHDGHLYEVTRSVSGPANSVKAEAACDGQRVAAGAVAVRQYVHQVLGMSAEAFRSSVFCEQKQLDAFSGRRPEDRRKLVLDLLGITPLDRARDSARAQARSALEQIEAARLMLGDLEGLGAEATELGGRLVAAEVQRVAAEAALAAAEQAEARRPPLPPRRSGASRSVTASPPPTPLAAAATRRPSPASPPDARNWPRWKPKPFGCPPSLPRRRIWPGCGWNSTPWRSATPPGGVWWPPIASWPRQWERAATGSAELMAWNHCRCSRRRRPRRAAGRGSRPVGGSPPRRP